MWKMGMSKGSRLMAVRTQETKNHRIRLMCVCVCVCVISTQHMKLGKANKQSRKKTVRILETEIDSQIEREWE